MNSNNNINNFNDSFTVTSDNDNEDYLLSDDNEEEESLELINSKINNEEFKIHFEEFIDLSNKKIEEIIELYNKYKKITSFGDIYNFVLSKDENIKERVWPKRLKNIKDKTLLKNKKNDFRKSCKKFIINKENRRLYEYRKFIYLFNGKVYIIKSLILLEDEVNKIINLVHNKFLHIGVRMLQYEIEHRVLYFNINNITSLIKQCINNCSLCLMHKLNKYIIPDNIQIISNKPLERVQVDITFFKNKLDVPELQYKYLLNFTDHFSKFSKCYLIENKTTELVIEKFKNNIERIGKSSIIQSDNGGEFISNKYKIF